MRQPASRRPLEILCRHTDGFPIQPSSSPQLGVDPNAAILLDAKFVELQPVDGTSIAFAGKCRPIGAAFVSPVKANNALAIAAKHYPELNNYAWPPRGGDAERKSLTVQSANFKQNEGPSAERRQATVEKLAALYPRAAAPDWITRASREKVQTGEYPRELVTMKDLNPVLDAINKTASPGYPYALHIDGGSKGKLCEDHKEMLLDAVNLRLRNYLEAEDISDEDPTKAMKLLRAGMVDLVRVFVKNEPHTLKKIEEGRLRLISSVSFVDEIIERLIFGNQNELEILNYLDVPSKPGIGFSTDEVNRQFFLTTMSRFKRLVMSDVKAWDWSVQYWLFLIDLETRKRLVDASPEVVSLWYAFARRRIEALSWTVFATSDGYLYAQTAPGIMLSGSYLTSSTNSRCRVGLAFLAGADYAEAMGDDCNEDNEVEGIVERYRDLGFRLTDVKVADESEFEFCSHIFRADKATPMNFYKGMFRLLSKKFDPVEYMQFISEYRHCPETVEFVHFADQHLSGWCG